MSSGFYVIHANVHIKSIVRLQLIESLEDTLVTSYRCKKFEHLKTKLSGRKIKIKLISKFI